MGVLHCCQLGSADFYMRNPNKIDNGVVVAWYLELL
jgi:hypothetical protein